MSNTTNEIRFTKDNLKRDGECLYFWPTDSMADIKFVARFKRIGGLGTFATFLRKNFTVQEYFERLDRLEEGPLTIAESKGYLLPHIKRWLREGGYPVTRAGYDAMHKDQISRLDARMAEDRRRAAATPRGIILG